MANFGIPTSSTNIHVGGTPGTAGLPQPPQVAATATADTTPQPVPNPSTGHAPKFQVGSPAGPLNHVQNGGFPSRSPTKVGP